jgi:peptidoglycan hydrolase-like protein with peptidoglycan-binding domain
MHKWFANTDCPGPYLESKFPYIAAEVNKRLGVESATVVPEAGTSTVQPKRLGGLPLLKLGVKGETVRALQILLIGKGYDCGKYGADGDFGTATDKAVRAYQKDKGLTVDAIAGKDTMTSLLGV